MANLWEQWDPDNPDNNSAAPPNGAPENATNISDLNNIERTLMQSDAQLGRDLTAVSGSLGTMAAQNADAVAITGGSVDGVTMAGPTITGGSIGDATSTLAGDGGGVTNVNAADSAKLNGYTYDELMPIGSVIMWFGIPADRPPGWELCDGVDGRPKLTGNMPFGVDVNHPLGTEAGTPFTSINGYDRLTALGGDHDHGGATGGHALTNAEMPVHSHPVNPDNAISVAGGGQIVTGGAGAAGTVALTTGDAGGGAAHSHDITASGDHQHSYNVNPPRLAIYFLIKVANVSA